MAAENGFYRTKALPSKSASKTSLVIMCCASISIASHSEMPSLR